MRRIGIYGGAFNPPHLGHIQAAKWAVDALGLDMLLMIPSCISPHKQDPRHSASGAQRLEMLCLALQNAQAITASDLELSRGGTSYTYQTVEQLRVSYPDAELILFMGTDMFLSFHAWREPERILKQASIGVFYRGSRNENADVMRQKAALEAMGATVYLVDNPVTEISSTDLRRMLIFGCGKTFLPESVHAYICSNGLYGIRNNCKNLSLSDLEEKAVELLNPGRINHVLGCKDTAVALARHWGADETDAARAALLHDITKALDGARQLTLCDEYGVVPDTFLKQNPKTLHAFTGSLVAEYVFGESKAVVDAVRFHTTGKADMTLLEKIIYVADYMEPNREFPGVDVLRQLAYTDLDMALMRGLEMTIDLLTQQGREVSPVSRQALQYINEKIKSRKEG